MSVRFSRPKLFFFALLPAVLLFAAVEGWLRFARLASPFVRTHALPEELAGIQEPDGELFWRNRSGFRGEYRGKTVTINRRGHRSAEISDDKGGAYRILSLGESSTFGVGVEDGETYSAVLERLLEGKKPGRDFQVVNAGVSAWSSFQSLTYLKTEGLRLLPDLVLFYHEVNDFLPTTLRESGTTEIDIALSDKERYHSARDGVARRLMAHSALYNYLASMYARRTIRTSMIPKLALADIGLADLKYESRVQFKVPGARNYGPGVFKRTMQRVTPAERREIFEELVTLCRERGIALVIIHPSYRESKPHECFATSFAKEKSVPLLEAYPYLHPEGVAMDALYADSFHPTARGHQALAEGLAELVVKEGLIRAGALHSSR